MQCLVVTNQEGAAVAPGEGQQGHWCHKAGGQGGISCCIGILRGPLDDRHHDLSKDNFSNPGTNTKLKSQSQAVVAKSLC